MRPHPTIALALCLLVTPPFAQEERSAEAGKPRPRSVLFYLMDTCRHDRMGYDGYERKTTPFLDWLAERAVVFESSYSQAPWTKPSMASLLTSQYPSTTGVYRVEHRLPEEFRTWPEVLQANGMHTAGFSANIVMGNLLSNFAQGFDHFTESTQVNGGDPIRFASGSAKKLNEHAFAWLDENEHWPMLLYMHSVDPHEEYEPEPDYLTRFADSDRHTRFREEWKKLLESRPPIPGLYVTQDNFDRTGLDSASFIAHASDLYDGDVRANDDQLQRLWDKLQQDGWGEDFIFVFTSDHGEEFFEHGGTSHGYSLYDEMIQVPLMIYAPGLLPAGKRISTPVRSLDIYPTLCGLLGFDVPADLKGQSLLPLIREDDPRNAPAVFSEHREDPILRRMGQGSGVLVSLRSGRWKFILNQESTQFFERPRFELYDLVGDPDERSNVADEYTAVVKRLELEAVSFIANQWGGAAVLDSPSLSPEVADQLRALGYLGEEEGTAPDLWAAMETGELEEVERCLEAGADPDQLDEVLGVSPLGAAAMAGDVDLALVLLENGADVNVRGSDGSTPLHGAAFLGRVDVLSLLLEEGGDSTATNAQGDTLTRVTQAPWDITEYIAGLFRLELDRAEVEEGRRACVELLKEHEKSSPAPPKDPTARLFAAIGSGNEKAAGEALAAGASLKDRDANGATPLYLAAFLGREDIARLLLGKGAKVHTRNKDMASPLHGAALMDRVRLVELLLEDGADVEARDAKGTTPLHAAAFLGRVRAVECLLRESADPTVKDEGGLTALDVTRTDWPTTQFIIQLLGLDLKRAEVEKNRAEVAKLLRE